MRVQSFTTHKFKRVLLYQLFYFPHYRRFQSFILLFARLKFYVTNYLFILGGVCSSHFRARNFGKNRTESTSPCRKNRSLTNRHRHGLRPISNLLDYDLHISRLCAPQDASHVV